ncbi:MAG: aquaporin [Thermoleophilaceae bacterium]|nr:aquaporin [Thermoleophilaceae bacterium]
MSTPVSPPARGPAAYVAELIGTFTLVFFICMVVSEFGPSKDFLTIGLAHVLVLFFLIQTLAVVSGAHFNPAVTIALTALRQIKASDSVIYIILQLTGAILGALAVKLLLPMWGGAPSNLANVGISPESGGVVPAMAVELLGTFFLMWTIVGVAVNAKTNGDWAGFAIGGTLGVAVIIGAQLTGAGYNPARAFGPALVSGDFGDVGSFVAVYVVAPIVGALLATAVYFRVGSLSGARGGGGGEGPVG